MFSIQSDKEFPMKVFQFQLHILLNGMLLLCVLSAGAGSLPPKDILFKAVDTLIATAKEKKADIYLPETFSEGMEYYQEAEELYQNKEEKADVDEAIRNAILKFEKAIDETKVASVFFTETMVARVDAEKVNAPLLDPITWKKAENKFKDAAEDLEDGDSNNAKERGKEAEKLYRNAELKAIQSRYLKDVWGLLARANKLGVDEYAPITLNKAIMLEKKSAALLHLHRYDQTEAAQLAKQAEYEAKHAIYLAKYIKRLDEEDHTFEMVLLTMEGPLQKIAQTLDMTAEFDQGIEVPANNIVAGIEKIQQNNTILSQTLEREKNKYSQTLITKNAEITALQTQLETMGKQLSKLSSTKEQLKQEVEQERIRREKIARISSSFLPSEGKALLDGEHVIIRLYGLTFPPGKFVIEPQYFNLLSKVKNAFAEFPGCRIIIEGHTDSRGGEDINQKLSENRADAVRAYIIANSNITAERIQAVGYGENRPVASNETEEGQAKNRRIDVVIQPGTAK